MDHEFWRSRWESGQIGFHLPHPNPRLVAHHTALPPAPARVFVPLCGKSVDLVYLASLGYEVVGAELSALAVQAFFAEQGLSPTVSAGETSTRYQAGAITIHCGDVLALTPAELGVVEGLYDRAALVALPPVLRARYALHLRELCPAPLAGLMVCFEYRQSEMAGPPFSVPEPEVRALFEPELTVTELARYDILAEEPRFRASGLSALEERVYRLTR
jgi:thiopurine S-methyltransferase